MKKIIFLFTVLLVAAACNSTSTRKQSDETKKLTVTIEPQRFFLEQIVGSGFSVNVLVPPGTSPETYEPAPSVMVEMGRSDMYFRVGDLGFENAWSQRLAANNPDVEIVDCSAGIELIEGSCHDHDHGNEHHHHHHHGDTDPHVWTAPGAVRILAKNMYDAVVAAYPDSADLFHANYNALLNRIHQTDSIIRATLNGTAYKAFIIYHPALGYFADEYGLQQHSIEFEGKSPSPAQVRRLVDLARAENIKTIFVQKGFDSKNAEVIATEIGAKVFEINPLAYEWDEELVRIAQILARTSDE